MAAPGSHEFAVAGSRTVYSGAIVALRLDQVVMPGGRVAEREVVEHRGAVAVVARNEAGELAVIRQYRHPVGRRLLELPAGILDGGPGETPLAAAQRELAEEAGLAARRWRVLVDLAASPGFTDEAVRVFLADDLSPADQGRPEHEEADLSLEWVPLARAVELVLAGEIVNAIAAGAITALAAAESAALPLRLPDAPWPGRPTAFDERR